MRRLSLILLASLAILPAAAFAARSAVGDGVLELRAANGGVTMTGKGVLWGQMDHGYVRVVDTDPSTKPPLISGAEHVYLATDNPDALIYSGADIRFRVTGGKYKLHFKGSGIDLTAIGVGIGDLAGNLVADDTGDYALDGGKWLPVPTVRTSVPFGTLQPAPVPGTP
jgi:hypothetical protein